MDELEGDEMTTVEKLLVQLFERKHSIIDLVKQQTESYSQDLACKFLIDGITPPTWLHDPNTAASKEISKDDLIFKILRPYPRPSVCCSVASHLGYTNLFITGDNEEFSDGNFVENPAFNEDPKRKNDIKDHGECVLNRMPDIDVSVASFEDQTDCRTLNICTASNQSLAGIQRSKSRQKALSGQEYGECVLNRMPDLDVSVSSSEDQTYGRTLNVCTASNQSLAGIQRSKSRQKALSGQDHGECVLNRMPDLDVSVSSSEDQIDGRTLNICTASNQSVAGIQRSMSWQKDLELRNSAKALAKSGLRHEIINGAVSNQINFSLSIIDQPGQNDEQSQLSEPCVSGNQSFEDRNVVEAHCSSTETEVDTYSKGITGSVRYAEIPVSVKDSFTLGSSSENYKENASSQDDRLKRTDSIPITGSEHYDNLSMKSPKSVGQSTVCCQSFRHIVEDADFLCENKETNVDTGESTRSGVSSKRLSCECDSTKADRSFDYYQGTEIAMMDSGDQPQDYFDESLVNINLSVNCNEGSDAQESVGKDFGRHKEMDTILSSSSIQHDEIINSEVSSVSAKVHGGILALSSAGSALQVSDSQERSGIGKPSGGLFRKLTRSQTRFCNKENHHSLTDNDHPDLEGRKPVSDYEEAEELQTTSSGQSVPPCHETHNMFQEGSEAQESVLEDFGRHKKRDTLLSSSSIQYNAYIDDISNLEVSSVSAKASEGILVLSNARSARQVNDTEEVLGLVEPSVGIFRRRTRSQTRSHGNETYHKVSDFENPSLEGTQSISECEENSAEEPQKISGFQSVSPCLGTLNMLPDYEDGKLVMASELILLDHVDQKTKSDCSKQRRGFKSEVACVTSNYFASMEPKQLEFIETEGYNLEAFASGSGNRRLDNLPQKMNCSLHASDASLVKGVCDGNDQPSSSKQSLRMLDVSTEENKDHWDSFETVVQESPNNCAEKFGPIVDSAILDDFKDTSTKTELNGRSSEVQDEAENLLSKMVDITDIQSLSLKQYVKHNLESSLVHYMEQGDCGDEGRDKCQSVSIVPERKNLRLSCSTEDQVEQSYGCSIRKAGKNSIAINEIKQCTVQQSQMLSWPEGEVFGERGDPSLGNKSMGRPSSFRSQSKNSSLARIVTHTRGESWPQAKKRRIGLQQAHSFTTSPGFRVTKSHSSQKDPDYMYPKTMEVDVDFGLMERVNMSTDDGICSMVNTKKMEGIKSPILSQYGETESSYIKMKDRESTPPLTNNNKLVCTISNLAMKETRNSQICFIERTRTSPSSCDYLAAITSGDKQFSQHLHNLENDGDQYISVFEGFTVNTPTESGELDFAAKMLDLGELELPRTTLERASILVEICKSASLDRLSSHFASAFKFQDSWNLSKSVPDDGHLEQMEFGNIHPLNPDVGIHFQPRSSSSDDYKDALDGMSYSVPLAYSGEGYGWGSRNQLSPVGKLWDQHSFHTGSSGKCSSSDPERTCFPIEEDPSSSDDNKILEENADDTEDETESSFANHITKRQPLEDLTNKGKCSTEEVTLRADSVDFMVSKLNVSGTLEKALLGPKYQSRKKSEIRERQTSSIGAADGWKHQLSSIGAADGSKHQLSSIGPNSIKKAKQSVDNSTINKISRAIVSNKTSLKVEDQKLSFNESRKNKTVSNVSSFIPLIQQKQAAADCTGKRDVKVKALEAAEVAKRLAVKKENERQMRKEARKIERAKLEEKNLREYILEKKKKEEEQKKKDAAIIAKKRLREEEEKKEKEKKRMRIEARQQQWEQEEKKRAERSAKETKRTKDAQMNIKKIFNNESKWKQNRETTKGEVVALQKIETKLTLNGVVNYEESGISGLSCEAGQAMDAVDKSPRKENLLVQNSKGKSYEISPYQCSDDEDEVDELPTKKYMPSWASKSSIALLLPLQQKLDPDVIFPPERFCSVDAVLFPRKLQQQQATT